VEGERLPPLLVEERQPSLVEGKRHQMGLEAEKESLKRQGSCQGS
jgi:hypothetical protein